MVVVDIPELVVEIDAIEVTLSELLLLPVPALITATDCEIAGNFSCDKHSNKSNIIQPRFLSMGLIDLTGI